MASEVYRGSSTWGDPILTIKDGKVYTGYDTFWNEPIAIIDGNKIYEGPDLHS